MIPTTLISKQIYNINYTTNLQQLQHKCNNKLYKLFIKLLPKLCFKKRFIKPFSIFIQTKPCKTKTAVIKNCNKKTIHSKNKNNNSYSS